jgi:prepilin-type N-terminal cleavage/methylation domain-containing protein/prepilin-type processing-associated H-X9-DG protein
MIIRKTFSPRKVAPKGFTLVELLVVISIIALLLSILMPSLGKARESARKVKCMAHVRSVGIALSLYAQDNKNCYPTGSYKTPDGSDFGWSGYNSTLYGHVIGVGGAKQLSPYITKSPDIVFCPSNLFLKNYYYSSYQTDQMAANVTYFPYCGRKLCAGYTYSPMKITDPGYLPVWGDITSSNQGEPYNNHGIKGGANWVFVDLHVELVKREKLSKMYRNPWIQFLGPAVRK